MRRRNAGMSRRSGGEIDLKTLRPLEPELRARVGLGETDI